jgi:heme/copper-type cytochrome/quinol oxidase subunit 3
MAHAQAQPLEHVEPTGIGAPKLGMWLFLSGEVVLFGGVIMTIVLFRISFPGWKEASEHTNPIIGSVNTFNLLTSSMLVALAHKMSATGNHGPAKLCILGCLAFGILFLALKWAIEWPTEIAHDYTIHSGPFWQLYYTATGLHAVHVLIGLIAFTIILVLYMGKWRPNFTLEATALYWHFVDIVWLFLWPLFYLS